MELHINRELISQKRSDVPAELLKRPDMKVLYLLALFDWAVIFSCSWLMLQTSYFFYPLWILIIAGRIHGLGVIVHDLTHINFQKKSFALRGLELLTGYPIGTTINAMAYHHLRHHRNTLMENDPYFNYNKKCSGFEQFILTFKKGPLFVPFWYVRSLIGTMAYYIPTMRTSYARIFLQDVSMKDLNTNEEVIKCCKEDRYLLLFLIGLIFFASQFTIIIYSFLIALPVAGVLCIYRLLIEHEYDIVDDRSVYTIIECSFDHHLSFLDRILFGPHGIGYHCMHHLHPNVGIHHLKKLYHWYKSNSPKYIQQSNKNISNIEQRNYEKKYA
ncbi:fatty acid desaturase [Halobacteriovorax sp. HLS]|uniref:fatty acid desaturase family protein n=1 Tax=Halobacteriovorax sp. HLS TaxID=2234000 RepID=UPI000FD8B129|nr:fatty acid desaturase [Halobacteriovorax sp. HLS]